MAEDRTSAPAGAGAIPATCGRAGHEADAASASEATGGEAGVLVSDGTGGEADAALASEAAAAKGDEVPARARGKVGTAPAGEGAGNKRPGTAAAKRTRRAPRKPKARRIVRWSEKREQLFLAALAESSNVAQAIRASGLSESNVYRRRQASAEFRARWVKALREGYVRLETMLLERALNGTEKPVWHGGKQVGTMREYSDRLALALLSAHRGAATGAEGPATIPGEIDEAELRARLAKRLSQMNIGMGGEG